MVPLEAKSEPELHNELRIRLLELIVFIKVLPIVIQIEVRVPTLSRFQRIVGCRSCSDDCPPVNMTAEAV
jgi:hypothetical protein